MSHPVIAQERPVHGNAREKLVLAALRLFADKGFEGASTREIADAAGANISAIRYYFGDKAGLYRAAFTEPLNEFPNQGCAEIDPALPLDIALQQFFSDFLRPLKQGESVRLVMKLHFREMIEPTGAWEEAIEAEIKPQHEALVRLLVRRFGIAAPDLDVQRLSFSIIGMAVHYYVGQDIVDAIAPEVLGSAAAIDVLAARLARYAAAMIAAEAAVRATAAEPQP
ncbi:MAG: CerR family C-terminal domain-containing protein [Burkholderiales bacterium]|nr:CerR family C-terminal domain-containing protein [Burkholderiales bacterium]